MTLQDVASLAIIFQSFGVIVAIIVFVSDLRGRKKALGYEAFLQSIKHYLDLEKLMMENPGLQKAYEEMSPKCYKNLEENERVQYHLLSIVLTVGEAIYSCRKKGWLEEDEWAGWGSWLLEWKNLKKFKAIFKDMETQFSPDFQNYVENLEGEVEALENKLKQLKSTM